MSNQHHKPAQQAQSFYSAAQAANNQHTVNQRQSSNAPPYYPRLEWLGSCYWDGAEWQRYNPARQTPNSTHWQYSWDGRIRELWNAKKKVLYYEYNRQWRPRIDRALVVRTPSNPITLLWPPPTTESSVHVCTYGRTLDDGHEFWRVGYFEKIPYALNGQLPSMQTLLYHTRAAGKRMLANTELKQYAKKGQFPSAITGFSVKGLNTLYMHSSTRKTKKPETPESLSEVFKWLHPEVATLLVELQNDYAGAHQNSRACGEIWVISEYLTSSGKTKEDFMETEKMIVTVANGDGRIKAPCKMPKKKAPKKKGAKHTMVKKNWGCYEFMQKCCFHLNRDGDWAPSPVR